MKRIFLCLIAAGGLLVSQLGAADPDKASDEYKKSGKKTAQKTKEAGTDLKHGEVTAGAKDFGKGVGSGAKHAAKGTAEGAKVTADKTEDVGEKAVKSTKKGAKKAGSAIKDSLDGHDEKK